MKTRDIALVTALLAAAITSAHALPWADENGGNGGGSAGFGAWGFSGFNPGENTWMHGGGSWQLQTPPPQTLPPVEIKGTRDPVSDFQWMDMTRNYLSPQVSFAASDKGITFPEEAKLAPPANKDRDKCLKTCGEVQALENALCDDRAVTIGQAVDATAATVWIWLRFRKGNVGLATAEMNMMPGKIFVGGNAAAATYRGVCMGRASTRYLSCINNTCKA